VRVFLGEVGPIFRQLEDEGRRDLHVLFLDASDETIIRRFSETRRPHPLATDGQLTPAASVLEGVTIERERLSGLRASATRVVDTTPLSVHDLRKQVLALFGPTSGSMERMAIRVLSFGFKYGAPADADLVLDVRFLKNPYFIPELKRLPGTEPAVREFVMNLPETTQFLERTLELLRFVVPKYEQEGKSYLTIAIGCTGGMHRSVVLAEHIAKALDSLLHAPEMAPPSDRGAGLRIEIATVHRDVSRKETPAVTISRSTP